MNTLLFENKINVFEKEEFDNISNYIFSSFLFEFVNQDNLNSKQIDSVETYIHLLEKLLLNNFFKSKKAKADILHFLTKLQYQKELLEMAGNPAIAEEYTKAAKSFEKKICLSM